MTDDTAYERNKYLRLKKCLKCLALQVYQGKYSCAFGESPDQCHHFKEIGAWEGEDREPVY